MKNSLISSIKLSGKINKYVSNVPLNKQNKNIFNLLYLSGIVSSYSIDISKKRIYYYLSKKYNTNCNMYVTNISKPGRKVYISYDKLKKIFKVNKHIIILSTSKGILDNKTCIKYRIGGELLFLIKW